MIRVGTSGWSYPEWRGILYPKGTAAGDYLKTYAENFATVEINNSFYRLPQAKKMKNWAEKTPPGFLFSVKAWRAIVQAAEPDADHIKSFFSAIDVLADKLGPVLFQLPPNRDVNVAWLKAMFRALPHDYRYVFELRDRRWLTEEIYDVLCLHNAANCFYDLRGFRNPEVLTSDWFYIRLHGPLKQAYKGGYSAQRLSHYAEVMNNGHNDAYCYFDNTMSGNAVDDARTLLKYLGQQADFQKAA